MPVKYTEIGTKFQVTLSKTYADAPVEAEVVKTPFKKPDSAHTFASFDFGVHQTIIGNIHFPKIKGVDFGP